MAGVKHCNGPEVLLVQPPDVYVRSIGRVNISKFG